MRGWLLALLLIAAPAIAADSMGRGYTARNCGFDWDQDGTIGEATGDCNIICNATSGTGPITSDLDSDGDNEEEYYVDCDAGSNSNTGGPDDAFLTITYALSQADGPGDLAEDIICFKGTCSDDEGLTPPAGDSAEGYWTDTASGNEVRDWRYPQDPGGIFGWDADNDGNYPPFDTDDTAIIDGTGTTSNFHNFDFDNDYFQVGHFSVDNFAYHNLGNNDNTKLFSGSGDPEYFRVHDIEVDSWNEGGCAGGDTRVINNGMGAVYGAYENIDFKDIQGKFMRGGASYSVVQGPVRIKSISWLVKGMYDSTADASCQTGADDNITLGRSWGTATGYEILDSRFDGNLDAFYSSDMSANDGHAMSQCLWDWDIINNYYKDIGDIVAVDAGDNFFCTAAQGGRITKDLNVERNEWIYTSSRLGATPVMTRNADCYDTNVFDGSLKVVNNQFITHSGGYMKYGVYMQYGSATNVSTTTGETLIANNTFNIDNKDYANGAIILVTPSICATQFDQPIRIYNNIINGLESGERAVTIDDGWPGTLEMDNNIYESVATSGWLYGGTKYHTLAAWRTAISDEANSDTCLPTYISGTDFHLDTSDTCAQEDGVSMASDFTDDFDGDARPQGSLWDIGMDEYESGYSPPDGACCTGESCAITTESNCAGGSEWQGAETLCSPNPCSASTEGATCSDLILEGVSIQ